MFILVYVYQFQLCIQMDREDNSTVVESNHR